VNPSSGFTATVVRSVPLRYAAGADPALDRPAHVRSASALARIDGALVVVQDDAGFLALADPATGLCRAVTLPAGEGGLRQFDDVRGNKRHKLDLEAGAAVPDPRGGELLLAFGSGSTAARESVVVVRGVTAGAPEVRVIPLPALYALLRAEAAFSGSELNLEGAVYLDGKLALVNRGNGAARPGRAPVDAIGWMDAAALLAHVEAPDGVEPPPLRDVVGYELGRLGGARLTFTDLAVVEGELVFTACAEDSPNAVDDGPVAGSAIGWIGPEGALRIVPLTWPDGSLVVEKVEGIATGGPAGGFYLCTDPDAPEAPSLLLEVEVGGGGG
jgi:hypothetical protein